MLPVAARDQFRDRLSQYVLGGVAEHHARAGIPRDNLSIRVGGDDSFRSGLRDGSEFQLRFAERLLRLHALDRMIDRALEERRGDFVLWQKVRRSRRYHLLIQGRIGHAGHDDDGKGTADFLRLPEHVHTGVSAEAEIQQCHVVWIVQLPDSNLIAGRPGKIKMAPVRRLEHPLNEDKIIPVVIHHQHLDVLVFHSLVILES